MDCQAVGMMYEEHPPLATDGRPQAVAVIDVRQMWQSTHRYFMNVIAK